MKRLIPLAGWLLAAILGLPAPQVAGQIPPPPETAPATAPEAAASAAPQAVPPDKSSTSFADATRKVTETLEQLGIEFYGHFRLDMAHDSARTQFGDTAFYVQHYRAGQADDEINIHARHSRLGLNWRGPEIEGVKAFGNIEIDFLGKALQPNTETQELQATPRLRHAYMQFAFGKHWSLLAGHTSDTFAPLNMKKLNTLVGWGQGNLGFRRPQLTGITRFGGGGESVWTAKLGLARPLATDQDGGGNDDGEDAGYPDVQGHIGFAVPLVGKEKLQLGVGGFVGWREVDATASNRLPRDRRYTACAACLDFVIPILQNLSVCGEVWWGRGLDGYRAAIWQGYSLDGPDVSVIRAWGAFANLEFKPHKRWRLVAGAGMDDPENEDFTDPNPARATKDRTRNVTLFGNVVYNFYKGASVGLEYDYMNTDYVERRNRVNHRVQATVMLKF
ncbi:MAG: hypothetical protein JXQ29_17155 [Planctomycetes bacterium]|nr:hypothetical protein [Planctomycetota bacterium]